MNTNRAFRVLLITLVVFALGFLDYKTSVDFMEVEQLSAIATVLKEQTVKNGGLPATVDGMGSDTLTADRLSYQKLSENEFSLAFKDRNYFIDQDGAFHSPNAVAAAKLSLWQKFGIHFQFLYLFFFGAIGIMLYQRSRRYRNRPTTHPRSAGLPTES